MRTILTSITDLWQSFKADCIAFYHRLGWQGFVLAAMIGVLCSLLTRR